ncbi:hypothetical protein BS78_02G301100 [Paspalum vaginatum]|nr:hypothetical protein BS78_02G301100 [Paspalum vaginatum]KAJ1291224.1 hypothetical protein BS78_02G301100 [Paspalum vaginatum]
MKNPLLLSLIPLLLLAVSLPPVSAAIRLVPLRLAGPSSYSPYDVECLGDGVYVANSTYQANLRRVAALLVADASATRGAYYTSRSVGYWPNRLLASSFCYGDGTASDSSCAACIAGAFLGVERACPYHREAYFSSRNCTLQLDEFRIFGVNGIFEETNILKQALASGLIFQAIGFAWLSFLLLQEWRSRKRGTLM